MIYVLPIISTLLSLNYADSFIYIDTPLPFFDAKQFCKDNYGTNLAAITNDNEINEAVSLMENDITAWTGLYSRTTRGKYTFLGEEDCPDKDSAFRCVDFWLYRLNENTRYRPRCIGQTENGEQCSYFNPIQLGVDNNIPCTDPLPFLCTKPDEPSYTGRYVLAFDEDNEANITGRTANDFCQREYGTDLATILTDDDLIAASTVLIESGVDTGIPITFAWVGLSDADEEGNWEWRDGSMCATSSVGSVCTDYFYFIPDDIGDITGESNADCAMLIAFGDDRFIIEEFCGLPFPVALCNAPDIKIKTDSPTTPQPTTDSPTTVNPTTDSPTTNTPTTSQPSSYPTTLQPTTSYPTPPPGRYVATLDSDGVITGETANEYCQSEYGTDLATILTENDRNEAGAVLAAFPDAINFFGASLAWIGLTDVAQEGTWEWNDGRMCATASVGTVCTDYFIEPPDNVGDITGESNADCVMLATDGLSFTFLIEEVCDISWSIVLCNAPDITSLPTTYEPTTSVPTTANPTSDPTTESCPPATAWSQCGGYDNTLGLPWEETGNGRCCPDGYSCQDNSWPGSTPCACEPDNNGLCTRDWYCQCKPEI